MKAVILFAVAACGAAAGTLKLSDGTGHFCSLTKDGAKISASCDFKTSTTSLNDLAAKVGAMGTTVSAMGTTVDSLVQRVSALEATDKIHRTDIDKKAQKGETGARGHTGAKGSTGARGVQGI